MSRGLTQAALAGRAGLGIGTVRDIEQGRCGLPRPRSLRALAEALDLSRHDRARLTTLSRRDGVDPPEPEGPAHISVLGPLMVTRAERAVAIGSGRHRVVLARLALTPGRPVGRDELIQLIWGDDPPPAAPNVVQTHVSRLRRILDPQPPRPGRPPTVTLMPGGYQLNVDRVRLDLLSYRARLSEAQSERAPQRAFDLIIDALDLWHGDDVVEDVPELSGDPLVVALAQERVEATVLLARHGEALRRQRQVLPLLRRLAERHPWHESVHARLIVALAAAGQQAAALEVFDKIRHRLVEELGIDPGAELREARQALLAGQPEPRNRISTTSRQIVRPWQAPAPPPDFCGRTAELRSIERALRYPAAAPGARTRVVCVVSGMAGVGKTSFALSVAQAVRRDYPDGQVYLNLRGAEDRPVPVGYALARLLRALGVPMRAIPADEDEAAALYRSTLHDRRVLVLLDNAHDALQVRPLLPGPGDSAVVVTSRNRCAGLDGAVLTELPVLARSDALTLLRGHIGTARLEAERESAEAVVEACGRLPLALRLVASRLAAHRQLTIADALRRLSDEHSRHELFSDGPESVMHSFALSCRDLPHLSATVFRDAALVPGDTVSVAAVAALVDAEPRLVGQALDNLVAMNLLQPAGPGRYQYHDLLRLYAVQSGSREPANRPAALRRLYDWYLTRTAAAMKLVYADMVRLPLDGDLDDDACFPTADAALEWLNEEIGSLVAAVEAAALDGDRNRSWQLADQLRGYFFVRGDVPAWQATGHAGLAAAEAEADIRAQAAMHQTIGQAHWAAGRHQLAETHYRRGIDAARRSGWLVGEAYLSHNLGLVRAELGRVDEAELLYQRALHLGTEPEFDHIRAVTLNDLATLCHERGQLMAAVDHLHAALRLNDTTARHASAMVNRSNLGMVLRQFGDLDAARTHFDFALAYYRRTGAVMNELSVLDELSQLNRQRGEWLPAVNDAAEALRLARSQGNLRAEAATLNTLGFALLGSRAVNDAEARFAEALLISRDNGYRYFEAQACIGVAEVFLLDGAADEAYRAAGEALDKAAPNGYRGLHGDALLVQAKAAMTLGDLATADALSRAAGALLLTVNLPDRLREHEAVRAQLESEMQRALAEFRG
ncbi:BTAD domain-containing putative transcriptional regulator [Micromonospora sp. CA-249363]|uniref:BTAD domain-containing putative transcriptional regulator n=1 Tax=Micromonospora sp. CA-249363 TaxID=3239963 RepID=UPI003D91B5A5